MSTSSTLNQKPRNPPANRNDRPRSIRWSTCRPGKFKEFGRSCLDASPFNSWLQDLERASYWPAIKCGYVPRSLHLLLVGTRRSRQPMRQESPSCPAARVWFLVPESDFSDGQASCRRKPPSHPTWARRGIALIKHSRSMGVSRWKLRRATVTLRLYTVLS